MTSLGDNVFSGCSGLTGSLTIPGSVKRVDSSTFKGCSGLTEITILDGVESIGAYAFFDCGSLTRITIPGSVTGIGDYAFSGCGKLEEVEFGGTRAQWESKWKTLFGQGVKIHCADDSEETTTALMDEEPVSENDVSSGDVLAGDEEEERDTENHPGSAGAGVVCEWHGAVPDSEGGEFGGL